MLGAFCLLCFIHLTETTGAAKSSGQYKENKPAQISR